MSRLRLAWVLGWAIPPAWFRPIAERELPLAEHILIEPSPRLWGDLAAARRLDWIVGYSLGSLLLLQNPAEAGRLGRVALLAPIWAFPAEAGAGGRIPRANLRALARLYRNAPAAALDSFYAAAGIEVERGLRTRGLEPESGLGTRSGPARPEVALQLWGLEQLSQVTLLPSMPTGWSAWMGDRDPLLDAASVHARVPEITIVPGAAHHPAPLIAAFAARLASS
jgi:hypothetical protein